MKKWLNRGLLVIAVIGVYFVVWRPFRGILMSFVLKPVATWVANPPMVITEGTSSVNLIVYRADILLEESTPTAESPTRLDNPRNKNWHTFKAPGDVWLLLGGIGLAVFGAPRSGYSYLFGWHILGTTLAYMALLIAVQGVPGFLYILDGLSSYIIPAGSMLLVIWYYKEAATV